MTKKNIKAKDMKPRKDVKGGDKPAVVGPLPPTTGGFQVHDEKEPKLPPIGGDGK